MLIEIICSGRDRRPYKPFISTVSRMVRHNDRRCLTGAGKVCVGVLSRHPICDRRATDKRQYSDTRKSTLVQILKHDDPSTLKNSKPRDTSQAYCDRLEWHQRVVSRVFGTRRHFDSIVLSVITMFGGDPPNFARITITTALFGKVGCQTRQQSGVTIDKPGRTVNPPIFAIFSKVPPYLQPYPWLLRFPQNRQTPLVLKNVDFRAVGPRV